MIVQVSKIIIFVIFINFVNIIIFMKTRYKTTIPITEEELKELVIVKASLEQTLKRSLTIRATFSTILQYIKERISTEEFKKEISSILEDRNKESSKEEEESIKEEEKQETETETSKENQEKRGLLSLIFKNKKK